MIVLAFVLAAQGAQAALKPIVLTHATVIDGRSPRPIPDATLVLSGGKIARIARGAVPAPPSAEVIDLQGRHVLPGLIDAHTHITDRAAATRALESGVTTVRSASTPFFQDVGLRELGRRGVLAGPEVLAAGVFVTTDLGESVLSDPRLADLAGGVNTADELRALVRINLDHGVDVIKTRATERAGLPEQDPRKQTYTEAQLRVIVETAAAKGIPVMCHAHGDEGARAAVRAGVRSIEHGTYLSDTTLTLMKQRGTYFVPTYSTVVDISEPGGDYDSPALRIRGQAMLPYIRRAIQHAHQLGVKIVAGGDTPYGPGSVVRISLEVVRFVELGMTPLEAIQSATTVAAELLGIERRTGALAEGLEADVIVVGGNPLDDITALEDVQVVISNGRVALNRLPFGK